MRRGTAYRHRAIQMRLADPTVHSRTRESRLARRFCSGLMLKMVLSGKRKLHGILPTALPRRPLFLITPQATRNGTTRTLKFPSTVAARDFPQGVVFVYLHRF